MAGRKFALCVAYWFFCFSGALILYFADAVTFEDTRLLYNDALEWALYGFYGFAGIEGTKEVIGTIRGNKNPPAQSQTDMEA
jgi:hypothetical protein